MNAKNLSKNVNDAVKTTAFHSKQGTKIEGKNSSRIGKLEGEC